jgi:molecular chaperone GrpE
MARKKKNKEKKLDLKVSPPPKDEPAENKAKEDAVRISDKRHWVRQDIDAENASRSRLPKFVETLQGQIKESEEQVNRVREAARKMREESDSFRRRLERDVDRKVDLAREEFMRDMLEVLDNLERSMEMARSSGSSEDVDEKSWNSLLEGLEMICNLFRSKFDRHGVTGIEVLDKPYNPQTAEALDVVETEDADQDNRVLEVFQKGYEIGGRTLRAARVRVAKFMKAAKCDEGDYPSSKSEEDDNKGVSSESTKIE